MTAISALPVGCRPEGEPVGDVDRCAGVLVPARPSSADVVSGTAAASSVLVSGERDRAGHVRLQFVVGTGPYGGLYRRSVPEVCTGGSCMQRENSVRGGNRDSTAARNCDVSVNVSIQRARLPRQSPRIVSPAFMNGSINRRAEARNQWIGVPRLPNRRCRVFALARAIPSTWNQLATHRIMPRRVGRSARDGS
jgi:hypothetical protein